MANMSFMNADDITDDKAAHFVTQAITLSGLDDANIDDVTDNELSNPETISYLDSEVDEDEAPDSLAQQTAFRNVEQRFSAANVELLTNDANLFSFRWFKWKKLKETIRRIFCEVMDAEGDNLDWKDIVKKVLTLVAGSFIGGIPGFIVTIVVSLLAKRIKSGIVAICP